ncbi:hypothetical protein [Nocardia sp. NPDC052566]|uniref:hypothetical protein n=1 Tax=Nocardia sp. NPDC052566 TaxID=3364330 RepID=UPI0037C6FB72
MTFDAAALRALEPDFRRAPSAHNTQPWTLTYRDGHADIGWHPDYALPAGDPTGRDLRLAMGAFVECCLIVCADAGLAIEFAPDHGERRIGRLIPARLRYLTPYTTEDIRHRTSHRGAYQPGPLDETVSSQLEEVATASGAGLFRVPGRDLRALLPRADRALFANPPAVRELRDWLRLTPRHPRYRQDGLTAEALALGRGAALGLRLTLACYPLLHRAGLPRLLAAASRIPLDNDVLVLVAPSAECDEIAMGRTLLRLWLTLSIHGYATHPLSQLIDSATTRAALADTIGVDDPARLLHVARVGRPATTPVRSHRRRGENE